jgi:hypothetical protein
MSTRFIALTKEYSYLMPWAMFHFNKKTKRKKENKSKSKKSRKEKKRKEKRRKEKKRRRKKKSKLCLQRSS